MKEEFEKLLEETGGLYTFDDIMERIRDGRMQSFSDGHSWVITQVHEFPRKKVVEISYGIGDLQPMLGELQDKIVEFAKSIGAEALIATGRLGWNKKAGEDWKMLSANYVRNL